jgi:predicted NBD/HSP70 family sugar kinase
MEKSTWIIRFSDSSVYAYVGTKIAAAAFADQMAWRGISYEIMEAQAGAMRLFHNSPELQ